MGLSPQWVPPFPSRRRKWVFAGTGKKWRRSFEIEYDWELCKCKEEFFLSKRAIGKEHRICSCGKHIPCLLSLKRYGDEWTDQAVQKDQQRRWSRRGDVGKGKQNSGCVSKKKRQKRLNADNQLTTSSFSVRGVASKSFFKSGEACRK